MPREESKARLFTRARATFLKIYLMGGTTKVKLRRIMSEALDKTLNKSFHELNKNLNISNY